jgi:hypothetical protein
MRASRRAASGGRRARGGAGSPMNDADGEFSLPMSTTLMLRSVPWPCVLTLSTSSSVM